MCILIHLCHSSLSLKQPNHGQTSHRFQNCVITPKPCWLTSSLPRIVEVHQQRLNERYEAQFGMQLRPATERKQQALVESNRQRRWFSVLLFVLLSFLVFFATALRDSGPHDKGLLSLCSCLEFHIRIQILQAEWVDMT